jgi:hypothetical protein
MLNLNGSLVMLKSWDNKPKIEQILKPQLLGQANIPKPLHGINPRTIMGAAKWAKHRQVIIQNNPYCKGCGATNCILDLHEDYKIDYNNCTMKIKDYVPLCKSCHSFIHSGLLRVFISNKTVSVEAAKNILTHGFAICRVNNISVFIGTVELAKQLNISIDYIRSWTPKMKDSWTDWKLIYEGKEYPGMSYAQWKSKYGGKA